MHDLRAADRVEITTLVDNYTDILAVSTETVQRHPIMSEGNLTDTLVAEHGLSWLIDIFAGEERHRLLFDFGWSQDAVIRNLRTMSVCVADVETAILSHGHFDHFGGVHQLYGSGLLSRDVPLILHPEVFNQRYLYGSGGQACIMPQLTRSSLAGLGVEVVETTQPTRIAAGYALTTGEIERVTGFEPGFPPQKKFEGGELVPDTVMLDEQALVLKVRDKGLVVVSSCSHPGIINTVLQARGLTGEDRVYAVVGGFHLSGPLFEPLIERTITEMKTIAPQVVVPTHCTGMRAINRFAEEMPQEFILNTVGAKLRL